MEGVQRALEDVAAGQDAHAERRARLRTLFHADPVGPATPALLHQLGLTGDPASACCFPRAGLL
jgi:hypothetical protein